MNSLYRVQIDQGTNSPENLGPTHVHNPNGISIGLAVFAGLTVVTDRQTTLLHL